MFLGASRLYPRGCPQPLRETYWLTGPLDPTHEPCAIARIADSVSDNRQHGRQYVGVMPTSACSGLA